MQHFTVTSPHKNESVLGTHDKRSRKLRNEKKHEIISVGEHFHEKEGNRQDKKQNAIL